VLDESNCVLDACEAKFREEVYDDVLIERYHEDLLDGTMRAGWINLPLQCSRFMYAFVPIEMMWVMAFSDLQRAYKDNREEWIKRYALPPTTKGNRNYKTVSIGVPIRVLRNIFPVFTVQCVRA
jgi:hypothetical protein